MTGVTEALKVSVIEPGSSLLQRDDVIHHLSRLHASCEKAMLAERLTLKVLVPDLLPSVIVASFRCAAPLRVVGLRSLGIGASFEGMQRASARTTGAVRLYEVGAAGLAAWRRWSEGHYFRRRPIKN